MKIKGEKFLVAGLGKTGSALCSFLSRRGADVTATDMRPRGEILSADSVERLGVKLETGGHRESSFTEAQTVLLSPGVSPEIAPVRKAVSAGVQVMGEAEFSFRLCGLPIIAVTGSNGKTTTTAIIADILKRCGKRPFVGGNFGEPFISAVGNEHLYGVALLEMSSFQLKTTLLFKPHLAVMLNISPNHLDVHSDYGDYFASKKKIFARQTPGDWAVARGSDSEVADMLCGTAAKKVFFEPSLSTPHPENVTAQGSRIFFRGREYDLSRSKLHGKHNFENAMAAVAVSEITGCGPEETAEAITDFSPLPHRMEFVREVAGARVYDDSKATNPAATATALSALAPPVVLISGGKDKKTGYSALRPFVKSKVSSLVLFGEARGAMLAEFGGIVKTVVADSLRQAVESAVRESRPGGSILFSPSCSSFDMFSSFEERGREFKKIVNSF